MKNKSAVIVETRNLPNLIQIIDDHMKYLDESWHLTIFGSIENKDILIPYYQNAQFICLEVPTLTQLEYSRLLTTIEFWNNIPYENILIFQPDSLLLRSGIDEFLDYDYIGGEISVSKYHFPYMNGGLSLRKKSIMLKIIELFPYDEVNYEVNYEDIYFMKYLLELNANLPTKEISHKFGVEGVFGLGSLGMHAMEKYLTPEQCYQILNQYKLKITCLIPPVYDFLCATVMEGLKELSCNVSTSYSIDSDIILIFSNSDYLERKQFLLDNNLMHKAIYIDGSDGKTIEDSNALKDFKHIFKRELFKNDKNDLLPLPFAAEKEYFKFNNLMKDINISCTLREGSNPERKNVNELVKNLNIPNTIVGAVSNGSFHHDSSNELKKEYFKILARSKISISYPGCGWDCARFWEILSNKCLLFSPKIEIQMPNPFIEFIHYIPYDGMEDLKTKLLYYHDNEEEGKLIAEQGFNHLLEYHTTKKRAEYLISEIIKRKI